MPKIAIDFDGTMVEGRVVYQEGWSLMDSYALCPMRGMPYAHGV